MKLHTCRTSPSTNCADVKSEAWNSDFRALFNRMSASNPDGQLLGKAQLKQSLALGTWHTVRIETKKPNLVIRSGPRGR